MRETLPERERVPAYHYACEQSKAIIETLADASLEAKAALEDVIDQFFVDTATWGLRLWEQQVGIQTDASLSQAARRAAIKQKLVASGNTTAEMVRGLAESITGYEARVIVNGDYSFSLEFLGEANTLADINVEEVRSIVEQIKPAHLRFVISGLTWADVESVGLIWQWFEDNPTTWAEFDAKFCVHAKN
ncbi:putative phage tail protein [uncultured Dysosmobacter sp.]|uniref:putative phage tail protein n=1 Tax=uncultured Dysosmobacter sp. TaxID=2591384 RepID=UPI00260189CC|nr:putative phage tail protein [uncultured Dysosmobacter sp.]